MMPYNYFCSLENIITAFCSPQIKMGAVLFGAALFGEHSIWRYTFCRTLSLALHLMAHTQFGAKRLLTKYLLAKHFLALVLILAQNLFELQKLLRSL